jgi:hypothetical protein
MRGAVVRARIAVFVHGPSARTRLFAPLDCPAGRHRGKQTLRQNDQTIDANCDAGRALSAYAHRIITNHTL